MNQISGSVDVCVSREMLACVDDREELSGGGMGGGRVAQSHGGVEVKQHNADAKERRLDGDATGRPTAHAHVKKRRRSEDDGEQLIATGSSATAVAHSEQPLRRSLRPRRPPASIIIGHIYGCAPISAADAETLNHGTSHYEEETTAAGDDNAGRATDYDSDGMTTDEDGVTYEEYEWAGQTRIRVCTMVEGGFPAVRLGDSTMVLPHNAGTHGSGGKGSNTADDRDDDDEVDVDGDDARTFGRPQYTEADVERAIAQAVDTPSMNNANFDDPPARCLICMDTHQRPLTSIACWHVHCERCWLRALGVKKLCPQCNVITTPGELRRVYL